LYGLFFLIVALTIGAATRHFLQKIPLPFTVLLLLIGLAMGGLNRAYGPHGGDGHGADSLSGETSGFWGMFVDTLSGAISWGGNLDGHLILYVFLPILIFEAGFALDVHTFKKSFLNAFYLAGPGIVTATVMTGLIFIGLVMIFGGAGEVLADWNVDAGAFLVLSSMLFGAVVSATDPVAVVALLKELGASKKLGTLIEGESLLNDGTAIVAFVLLIGVVTGAEKFLGTGSFLGNATLGFGKIGAAGGLVGVLIGLVAILWVRKVFNDPLIEITVVLVTAYAVFFFCEYFFHVSGVLGLVALGIHCFRCQCDYFHCCWGGHRPEGTSCWDGLPYTPFGLHCHSSGPGNQYGLVLPPDEKGGLRVTRERCNCCVVGCFAWCDWLSSCPSGVQ